MSAVRYHNTLAPLAAPGGTAVALGFFDGVHVGHRAVIGAAAEYAAAHGLTPAVFTFGLPVKNALKGGRILTDAEKHRRIEALGIEWYLAPAFEEFRALSPEQFVRDVLIGLYHAKAVFCGQNFTFGKNKAGNAAVLQTLCAAAGVTVCTLPTALHEGAPVSSTRIRAALAGGDLPGANAMLGEAYRVDFPVRHGQGLGRTLGVPTINQVYPAGFQMPRYGIYITRVKIEGVWYAGATGLGTRPTVNKTGEGPTCETFIQGFSGNAYGEAPVLEFCRYLCPSRRFDTLDELRGCIRDAAEQSRAWFAAKGGVQGPA